MNDQANILRQLVREGVAKERPDSAHAGAARLIVVTGGKGGVGTTTIAANLAIAMTAAGHGCVLVDGNPQSADVTTLCGLDPQFGISHVVAGWRNVAETLLDGPGGLRVLPGIWDRQYDDQWTESAQARMIAELRALGRERRAAFVVIDAGAGLGTTPGRFWRAADLVLVVGSPDSLAIMDAYAAIKVHAEGARTPVRLVVNQAADSQQAAEVQQRLARACHRFLGLTLGDAGYVPILPQDQRSSDNRLFVLQAPESTAARYVNRLAQTIARDQTPARSASEGGTQSGGDSAASLACASG